jgi:FkbM family methyltransferase
MKQLTPPTSGTPGRWAEQAFELVSYGRRASKRLPAKWDRGVRELGKALINYRGARRAYGRQVLFHLLGLGSDVLSAPFGKGQLLVPADDQEVGRVVFATCGYERVYMAGAVDELRRAGRAVAGTTFVDGGANIGTSTIDALTMFGFGAAVCFEPDPRSFRLLQANLAINGLERRARTYAMALSAKDGSSLLQVSATNRADNRLVDRHLGAGEDDVVGVECRRFDTLVAEGAISVDDVGLFWIDAQGHEPFVLQGATTALAAGVPLVLEYTPEALAAGGGFAAMIYTAPKPPPPPSATGVLTRTSGTPAATAGVGP